MALWGKTDAEASRPNWINLDNYPSGTQLVFVDESEAQQEENKLRGIKGAGWYLLYEYTGSGSVARKKAELVVAMRVSAADAGDDNDDLFVVDRTITISLQPEDFEAASGSAVFSVTAAVSPTAALTYAWEFSEDGGTTWDSADTGWATGHDTNELTVTDILADLGGGAGELDGYQFRVTVSSSGATDVVSDVATLTITV